MTIERFSYVCAYYKSADMLREQVRQWDAWPKHCLNKTTFIVVDDCSEERPIPIDDLKASGLDVRAYRITVRVTWNFRAAANVGMHEAPDGWCLVNGIDHVLTGGQAARLFASDLDSDTAYKLKRRTAITNQKIANRGDIWLITRDLWWRAKGFDERFAGWQSGIAGAFAGRIVEAGGNPRGLLDAHLTRYSRRIVADSSCPLLPRNTRPAGDDLDHILSQPGPTAMTYPYERLL